ncbi:MAG: ABC transporter permease [Candidatus Aminicenantes bacterium]|jgi:putative ABC transport system permease protein
MLKNYITVILRIIQKHRGYSLINIVGLSIGIASCILILFFVQSELNYDRFHENAGNIYRVPLRFNVGMNHFDCALAPSPLAAAMVRDFSEVKASTRMYKQFRTGNVYVRYGDIQFMEEQFVWADPSVFDVFTIPFIEGEKTTALKERNSVVLTPQTAKKYFGEDDPIGKMLVLEDGTPYKVTGIVRPLPINSHFHFDFLATFTSLRKSRDPDWYDTAVYTYILVEENVTADQIESKFPEFSRKYYEPIVKKAMGISYEKFIASDNYIGFFLQPLLDIHLHSRVENEFEPTGNTNTVAIFAAIALIILIVACINFINLATARAAQRAKEVGIRKVVGSAKKQLLRQFLTESIVFAAIAICVALILVELFLPVFNTLVGKDYSLSAFMGWPFVLGILFSAVVIGMAAGVYPAFLLSSYHPVDVIKGKHQSGMKGRNFRHVLVVFQFVASIVLFISTFVIADQLRYVRNKNLGFDKEHIVIIQGARKLGAEREAFKERLKQSPNVINAAFTDSLPQMLLEVKVFQKRGEGSNLNHTLVTMSADYDFFETYDIKLKEGRIFRKEYSTDTSAVILNEAAVKALDMESPLGERLFLTEFKNKPYNVIGVIENIHLESLHFNMRPMASILIENRPVMYLSVRIHPQRIEKSIAFMEKLWREFVPSQPLDYVFYDDNFAQLYNTEIQAGKTFTAFAALAIIIAGLGLFGLASYVTTQKTKEIGIRKVLGASIPGIILLLNREFLIKVFVANIIAWPVAYFAMNKWLQNFAYRAGISLWVFVASAALALVISLLTVSYQTVRAASTNPVNSLRYE